MIAQCRLDQAGHSPGFTRTSLAEDGGMPAEKIGSIQIDINGFKSTQFADLVKHFAEIGKNSFQVPARNHVQFRTGSREMVDATIEAAIAGELTEW